MRSTLHWTKPQPRGLLTQTFGLARSSQDLHEVASLLYEVVLETSSYPPSLAWKDLLLLLSYLLWNNSCTSHSFDFVYLTSYYHLLPYRMQGLHFRGITGYPTSFNFRNNLYIVFKIYPIICRNYCPSYQFRLMNSRDNYNVTTRLVGLCWLKQNLVEQICGVRF